MTGAVILWLCIYPTWAGCAIVQIIDFPTLQECQQHLSTILVAQPGDGAKGRTVVALCRPPYPAEPPRKNP